MENPVSDDIFDPPSFRSPASGKIYLNPTEIGSILNLNFPTEKFALPVSHGMFRRPIN